jgi:hypothetical protein
MAENDIVALKELASGGFLEVALAPSDIGAATSESTVAKAKALVDEFTGDPALIYTSEGSNGWTTLTDPASFRSALELSTNGNAAGLYDNIAGQVGAVVNDYAFRINGDGFSADFDTANLTASRAYGLPDANGTLGLSEPADDIFRVVGSADATKKVAFEVDTNVPTTSTVALTVPATGGTIARTEDFAAPPSIGSTTRNSGAFTTLSAAPTSGSALTLTGGTVTASAPVIDATQTWNASGTTFTALRLNATNTASATASLLMDLQTGGTTQFSVRRDGVISSSNYYRFTGLNSGLFVHSAGGGIISIGASPDNWMTLTNSRMQLTGDLSLGRALSAGQSADTIIARDAANTLAQVNGTNAQESRLYGTFTSSTNYQRMTVKSVKQTLSALSGASATTTGTFIPDGAVVVGVTTRVATLLTGAAGYTIGDGTDADRWGDITGTAVGTTSDNRDWTAGTIECFTAGGNITLTAKTSNFTAGAIEICVFYLAGEAD